MLITCTFLTCTWKWPQEGPNIFTIFIISFNAIKHMKQYLNHDVNEFLSNYENYVPWRCFAQLLFYVDHESTGYVLCFTCTNSGFVYVPVASKALAQVFWQLVSQWRCLITAPCCGVKCIWRLVQWRNQIPWKYSGDIYPCK